MKRLSIGITTIIVLLIAGFVGVRAIQNNSGNTQAKTTVVRHAHRHVLIAYFSYSGTTKGVAENLHHKIGGKLVRIQPAKPYSSDYNAVSRRAGIEHFSNASPAVKTKIKHMRKYTDLFIGYPIWYDSAPMVIKTFLKHYNLRRKNIYFFTTSASDGLGKSRKVIVKAAKGAHIISGLPVRNPDEPGPELNHWLKKIHFIK